ncbi:MAG: MBL fold metallo-hydrolase [Actinobacteria bacterium]|nr:MBL fold metallo-hydrolase [Actinomycetota bacterium]MBI3686862.1 MBL fold metallo-hydrolase [Actinomycetota bacterium]
MRLTHLGHACLLVETGGARLLIDPGTFSAGFEELTALDAVLITHQHVDHVDGDRLPRVLAGNPDARLLAEPELTEQLLTAGWAATAFPAGETMPFAGASVRAVGGRHATIHDPGIPVVGNIGLVIGADGEPTLFHPGDSYQVTPEGIDILALPLNAPWTNVQETIDFAHAVSPATVVPVHDGLLSPVGRGVYLRVVGGLLPERSALLDLAGAGPAELTP